MTNIKTISEHKTPVRLSVVIAYRNSWDGIEEAIKYIKKTYAPKKNYQLNEIRILYDSVTLDVIVRE